MCHVVAGGIFAVFGGGRMLESAEGVRDGPGRGEQRRDDEAPAGEGGLVETRAARLRGG